MTAYILFIMLICLSAFFSSSETAFFNISKHRRHQLEKDTRGTARRVALLRSEPRSLLVTVLFGNELTNIAISIVSAHILHGLFPQLSLLELALMSASIVVPTLLIFGEITPKSVAALLSERVAIAFAYPLSFFSWLISPARWALLFAADQVTQLFGHTDNHHNTSLNEESFKALVEAGTREGVIDQDESELIHNAFQFADQTVGQILVPWSRVFTLEETLLISEAIEEVSTRPFSRIPVWSEGSQTVMGVLYAKDLLVHRWADVTPPPTTTVPFSNHDLSSSLEDNQVVSSDPPQVERLNRTVRSLVHRVVETTADKTHDQLLDTFKKNRKHLAIVYDSDRTELLGICTLEDILEVLFGPISEESISEDEPLFASEVFHDR